MAAVLVIKFSCLSKINNIIRRVTTLEKRLVQEFLMVKVTTEEKP